MSSHEGGSRVSNSARMSPSPSSLLPYRCPMQHTAPSYMRANHRFRNITCVDTSSEMHANTHGGQCTLRLKYRAGCPAESRVPAHPPCCPPSSAWSHKSAMARSLSSSIAIALCTLQQLWCDAHVLLLFKSRVVVCLGFWGQLFCSGHFWFDRCMCRHTRRRLRQIYAIIWSFTAHNGASARQIAVGIVKCTSC